MVRAERPPIRFRQAAEAREVTQRQVHLQRGARSALALHPGPQRIRDRAAPDLQQAERIAGGKHGPRLHFATAVEDHARRRALLGQELRDRGAGFDHSPRGAGPLGERLRHRPHPAPDQHPGTARSGQPALVVDQEVLARSRRVGPSRVAGQSVGHQVHRLHQFALEAEPVQVVGHRTPAQLQEHPLQLGADEALGGLLQGQRLVQQRRGEVVAQSGQLRPQRLVGPPVARAEEGLELRLVDRRVRAQQQVLVAGGGKEVVGVAADQGEVELELGQDLRRHQTQQVGARRLSEPRRTPERCLGAAGPSHDAGRLEHRGLEAGPLQDGCRHQPVVSGADHGDVDGAHRRLARVCGGHLKRLRPQSLSRASGSAVPAGAG